MMIVFNRFIVRHPWVVILAFALATSAFAVRLPQIKFDFDFDAIFPQDHPEIAYKKWALEFFAIEEPAIVVIVNDGPNGIFTPETLALVSHLSDAMSVMEGVDGDDLISLSEVDNITAEDDSLTVEPFFEQPPTTQEQADLVRRAVFENPMMVGSIVSTDGSATIVGVETLSDSDKSAVHAALIDIVTAAPHGDSRIEIAGRPVVESEVARISQDEISSVMGFVIAVAAATLALSLHSVRGVLLPLLVVLTSIIWTMGLMGWTGAVFSAINSPLPMMLVPIGIADGIHIIHHYLHTVAKRPDRTNEESVFDTMQGMFTAVVMTSLTTAAGLGALATSAISTNRNFGMFAAFGTLAAMIFSLTALPAILVVLPRPRRGLARSVDSTTTEPGPMQRAVERIAVLATEQPQRVIMATLAALIVVVAGMPLLTTDGSVLKNLPRDNTVRNADRILAERFSGSLPLEIVVDGNEIDAWKRPENLRAMAAFQETLEAIDGVGASRSIADYVRRMNAVMNPEDPDADRIPDTQELVAQYLLLYSISGEPTDFDDVVDYDYAIANIRAQVDSDHSPDLAYILEEVDKADKRHLASLGLSVHASGSAREIYEFIDLIVRSQISSLALALFLVWLMASVMLRSIVGGLLTSMPVALATLATLGGLGWVGEPIGVTTAIMSAIAIGVGVDYAVHFVARYRECCRSGMATPEAMRATLHSSGVAIFYNAVVVVAGFLAMATSEFLPPRAMGLLVAWNMVVCFVATITTLAALLAWLNPAFLRRSA